MGHFPKNISSKYDHIYRKYTESEYDIQNNNLLYKIHQKCQNTFEMWDFFAKFKKHLFLFYYMYQFHKPYFVFLFFCKFCKFCVLLKCIFCRQYRFDHTSATIETRISKFVFGSATLYPLPRDASAM